MLMGYAAHVQIAGTLFALLGAWPGDTVPPPIAELRLADGSTVRAELLQEHLEVLTRYGMQRIPIAEVRRVEFGLHYPAGLRAQLARAIGELASSVHAERQQASETLRQHGHYARPLLRIAAASMDPEAKRRGGALLKEIEEACPPSLLALRDEDLVQTAAGPIAGRIQAAALKCRSGILGDMNLSLVELRTLRVCSAAQSAEVTVDAAKFGSEVGQWLDTGVHVDRGLRLTVAAGGQVDLWPQQLGQYVAGPKGHNAVGRDGPFPAGALIGRLGEKGQPFLVGESASVAGEEEGKLYLHIVPSPWNMAALGSYSARLRTEPR